ncbi:MAG: rRNA (cytidine-2'-O-)-methyltransferase, partial [Dehalococcoidales bacterium]|nr:rRNA (cytidine-2'-O-)-methyltransferase [Dehalococcoidales bacterium]
YLGFLPRKVGSRRNLLKSAADESSTIVILESPHRLLATLKDMLTALGDRRIAVCRELTKLHEEIFRGNISQAIEHFVQPRGEFTLVVEGRINNNKPELTDDVRQQLRSRVLAGAKAKEAVSQLAGETGLSKKELYRAWLEQT